MTVLAVRRPSLLRALGHSQIGPESSISPLHECLKPRPLLPLLQRVRYPEPFNEVDHGTIMPTTD